MFFSTQNIQQKEPREIRLRRNQDTLIIVGTGVIIFELWSLLKAVFTLLLRAGDLYEMIMEESSLEARIVVVGIIVVVLLIDLILRLFVGMSAIAVGRGKKSRFVFVAAALILAFLSAWVVTAQVIGFVKGEDLSLTSQVSAVVELTSLVTLTQLINSAMAIRGIRREIMKQGKSNAA